LGGEGSEESEALGCVDPCCGVQAQPLLPPSGLRKSDATWLWWPGVVVVLSLSLSLVFASGRFNVDVSLGVSLAFLLALNVIPREG